MVSVATPTGATLIAYNVGFGDCMLLRVSYDDGSRRHVLFDFGSTALPARGGPADMEQVAHRIAQDCGPGGLDVVVVSHRHRDHISGFAGRSGAVIAGLKPDLVLQPWTEDPEIPVDAHAPAGGPGEGGRRGLRLGDVHLGLRHLELAAQQVIDVLPSLEARKGVTKTVRTQIEAIGMNSVKNKGAVKNIQKLSGDHQYLNFGSELDLRKVLPGVTVDVLGPPSIDQSKEITKMAEVDPVEFWHLAASSRARTAQGRAGRLFPQVEPVTTLPQEARWVIPKIDSMRSEELLALVRIMDTVLNNTSLILLLTIGNARLLFPGDAQLENWRYALEAAENSKQIRSKLAATTLYKVGHHGSLNATPRHMLWDNFARRGPAGTPGRLVTVMSTRGGKHGSEERSTEVPRTTLRDELSAKSDLFNTQTLTTKAKWWHEVGIPID